MKSITANIGPVRRVIAINAERLLVPVTIVGALFLAGWVLSLFIGTPVQLPRL